MIEKKSASQILNLGGTYTTLPNRSIDAIGSPTTLGVWVFLVSKPRDWSINQKNVCERFSLSKRNYYRAMAELKSVGLCKEYTKRNKTSLCGKVTVVVSSLDDWKDAQIRLDEYAVKNKIKLIEN